MISVLLPAWNEAKTIAITVQSILEQTFKEFELLVLDDGSTDETQDIVSSFKDQRIRYVKLPHQGLALTLNAGLMAAKFEIIARIDAGDLAYPERLRKQYDVLITKPKNCIVSCRYAVFNERAVLYIVNISGYAEGIRKRLALQCDFPHSGVMYYKGFIIAEGMYSNTILEDYELWLRIKNRALFQICPEMLMLTRFAPGSLSNANVTVRYKNQYLIQKKYYIDLNAEFGISDKYEELYFRAWREFFFGHKLEARKYWKQMGIRFLTEPKLVFAWLTTFFSENMFVRFKESRLKFKLGYYLGYFSRNARGARALLKHLTEQSILLKRGLSEKRKDLSNLSRSPDNVINSRQ